MNTEKEFWKICGEVVSQLRVNNDYSAAEPMLLKVLAFVKEHSQEREIFVRGFVEMIEKPRLWGTLITEFCMRELRYPEILQRAMEIDAAKGPVPGDSDAQHVIEAYGELWPPGHVFTYYSKQESPIRFSK